MPLTQVLNELQSTYNLSLSFSSNHTEDCLVTLNKTFTSPYLAMQQLCKPCNLDVQKVNDIYVIRQVKKENPVKTEVIEYNYKLRITNAENNEELGLSKIKINNTYYLADINGNFSFVSQSKELKFEISYLGYFNIDTLLFASKNYHFIKLKGFSEDLNIVEVSGSEMIDHISIGESPGKLSVNSQSKGFLAGESNNAMFNTLRLQPGILSAGEQSSDYVIWNSYKGQNHLIYDGITLFKTNTLDQTISGINPSIIKTIDVYKGAYNADIGDRVGGVIDIKSNTGNFNKFENTFSVNNQLVNGYLNIPIKSKSSLQLSFRRTFENPFGLKFEKLEKEYIRPETNFTDVNLKFSTLINSKNPLRVSFIGSCDSYKEVLKDKLEKELATSSRDLTQGGWSAYYGQNWNNGSLTDISISQSILSTKFLNNIENESVILTANSIVERSIKLSHRFKTTKKHQTKLGVNFIENSSFFTNDSSTYSFKNVSESLVRLNIYFTDNWYLQPKISIKYGLKVETPIQINQFSFQPRLGFRYKPTNNLNLYGAWGVYNQFMSELAILDDYQNNLYYWSILNEKFKSTQANHYVLGTSIKQNKWKFSTEGFYKNSNNLLTFYAKNNESMSLSSGNSKTYGLDFFMSKKIAKHNLWVSYTISKSQDYFDHYEDKSWQLSPQNQLHELKTAFIFNFHPIHCSANYVFGSGLTYSKNSGENIRLPYNRLDVAVKYKFSLKKLKLETGLSVLNLLNNKNLSLNSFSNFPDQENQFILSTPFTPFGFLKIKF